MKPHAVIEYVKYLLKAKDRHGVHSPFAYELSEKVLSSHTSKNITEQKWLPKKYQVLINNIAAHYYYNRFYCIGTEEPHNIGTQDIIILKSDKPGNWVRHFNKYYQHLSDSGAVLIAGIHKTKRHSAKWKRLHNHPKVLMSIDLYGVGLLFFKKEFKEKQHFVLKY